MSVQFRGQLATINLRGFGRQAGRGTFNVVREPYVRVRSLGIGVLQRRAGIKVSGVISPEELGFSPEHNSRYEPSHWFTLHRMLPKREVTSDDVLVDFGAGMGLVVCQAATRYPFRRVEGVELSDDLMQVAEGNVNNSRSRFQCQDIRLITGDALEYEIPDDLTIAYFANPFRGPVFKSVLDRLVASAERSPRRIRLIYINPIEEQMVLDAGFKMTRQLRGLRPSREWSRSNATRMYELTARASARA